MTFPKKVVMKPISQEEHRYDTTGDYWTDPDGTDQFRVTKQSDWRREFLILLHEFVEFYSCKAADISEPDILEFDLMFNKELEQGLHPDQHQPGDDPRAPYHKQHVLATTIEKHVCEALGLGWDDYNNSFD